MSSTTIKIALKRAQDIQPGDVIRLEPKDRRWRFVYNVAHDDATQADTEDAARIVDYELDHRYVLLRIANDPVLKMGTQYGNKLHTWAESVDMRGGKPVAYGPPPEFDDRLEILGAHDLVEVQVEVPMGIQGATDGNLGKEINAGLCSCGGRHAVCPAETEPEATPDMDVEARVTQAHNLPHTGSDPWRDRATTDYLKSVDNEFNTEH